MTEEKVLTEPHSPEACWHRVCQTLRAELGEEIYGAWFASLQFVSHDGSLLTVSVATKPTRLWLATHYGSHILSACTAEFGDIKRVCIQSRLHGGSTLISDKTTKQVPVLPPRNEPSTESQNVSKPSTTAGTPRGSIPIRHVFGVVCSAYAVSLADLRSSQRNQRLVRPRHVALYLAERYSGKNSEIIGQYSHRHATTVNASVLKVRILMTKDFNFKAEVERLEKQLLGAQNTTDT